MTNFLLVFQLSASHLLASCAVGGLFATLFLLTFCFMGVHIVKYAKIGWDSRKNKPAEPPPPEPEQKEPAPTNATPEPVYYIVEKKKRRAKPKYGEPKEIRFK